jgi:hypothetical protein
MVSGLQRGWKDTHRDGGDRWTPWRYRDGGEIYIKIVEIDGDKWRYTQR